MELVIENEHFKIYFENKILVGEIKKNVYVDLKVAKNIVEKRKMISNFQMIKIFIDVTEVKGVSKEARDYLGTEEGSELLVAAAICTNSKLSTFLANFFLKVNLINTNYPIKLFTNRKKAMDWLTNLK